MLEMTGAQAASITTWGAWPFGSRIADRAVPRWVVLPMREPGPSRSVGGCQSATRKASMPRYVVKRTFSEALQIPVVDGGAEVCRSVVEVNAREGATWVHSYVTEDKTASYCIYDAPSPEAIRKAAACNVLPVDHIVQVRVLDPYFYY